VKAARRADRQGGCNRVTLMVCQTLYALLPAGRHDHKAARNAGVMPRHLGAGLAGSRFRFALAASAVLGVAGCAVGPNFHRPAAPAINGYTEKPLPAATPQVAAKEGQAQKLQPGADVAGNWWALFRSPALTRLVAETLRRNPSLQAAQETLHQAQETQLASEGGFFPQISGLFNRQRQKISAGQSGVTNPELLGGVPTTYSIYTAQLAVTYTFDIWGQTRRTVEANAAQAEYQRFQLEGAANMLAANTVSTAINAAALQAEIDAENRLIAAEQRLLATVQQQFQLGGATGTDVATQQSQLANTEALVVPLQTQFVQARDQLAAYLGRAPSEADLPNIALTDLTLPADLPVSVPSQVVAQRPDIRASEAQLHQATANVGVAIANRLPQLTLNASIATAPARIGDVFTPGNGAWTILNQLAGPIFEGGTLLHQQRAAYAAARAAALNYRSTVVNAFQNVADVLTALQQDALAVKANEDAERAAGRALSLAQLQYGYGGVAYLTVLTAQTQYQNAVISLIRARAARYTDSVALFTALGGGWWNRNDVAPPPEGLLRSLVP
jgi:NodT family efflux transporter outer membrane factor (OMF) lipoprotein